ncbi:hypothetical protein FGO68_gene7992 [Halteria grandinella]|uniref:Uncharacterized protein n=1 Tax=Halteria grandinella TaxID=5974 RepID=A0A8J8NKS0_HALGN|nr:hypothetical protein FGO68_gene7992 [Halteria grandinella]
MNRLFNPIRDYFNAIYYFNDYAAVIGLPRFEIFSGKAKYFGQWYLRSTLRFCIIVFFALPCLVIPFIGATPGPKIGQTLGLFLLGLLFGAYDLCLISYLKGAKEAFERNQQKVPVSTLKASGFQADEIKVKGEKVLCHTCCMPLDLYNQLMQQNIQHISDQTLSIILSHNPDLADPASQRPIFLYTQSFINKISACRGCIEKSITKVKIVTSILILQAIAVAICGLEDLISQ